VAAQVTSRLATALALALALVAVVTRAEADDPPPPPPPPPAVIAPRAIEAGSVPYPPDGSGDASVVLELSVDDTGRVQDARVVEGREPFASVALSAATSWRFEPARRGDGPDAQRVAARIRTVVTFTRPEAPAAAEEESPSPGSAPIEEVNVRGARRAPPRAPALGSSEVRQLPGAFGDAFRAIEALPGATPIASGLPYFFVRGAPPGNTGFFLDGIEVPALFHLGVGPSLLHPGLIDSVDVYWGAYPARYGRFTGGVVAARTKDPVPHLHGEANVRVFDAGTLIEAPFADGRGVALASGRYSYAGLVVPLFSPDTRLAYWDYQSRVRWQLRPGEYIGVFAFGSFDTLKQLNDTTKNFEERLGFTFHRVDLRYDKDLGPNGHVRAATTVGYDQSGQQDVRAQKWLAGARVEIDRTVTDNATFHAGGDTMVKRYAFDAATDSVSARRIYPPRTDVVYAMHAEVVWRAAKSVELTPGIRGDLFTSKLDEGGESPVVPSIDPRVETRIFVSPEVIWIWKFGVAHQPPSSFVSLPGLDIGRLKDGLQTAVQASQGVELTLPEAVTFTATTFLHRYIGLTDAAATCTELQFDTTGCSAQRVGGRAYGLELLLRRALTKRVAGRIAYTLSRSVRQIKQLALTAADTGRDTIEVLSEFDRTHVLNVALSVDLGAGWNAGGRFVAYTGRPYSRIFQGRQPLDPRNAQRLDGFERLDLRLEKRFPLGNGGHISIIAEGLNVTLAKEALGVDCTWTPEPGRPFPDVDSPNRPGNGCFQTTVGPITVPSLGVEGAL
jgi:TonB family protein